MATRSRRDDAMLDALVRDVRARQQLVRELLIDDEDGRYLAFVGSSRVSDGASAVAASIRSVLGMSTDDQRRARDPSALFRIVRAAAESAGIFVLLLGDLGSYHSDIGDEVFRGFALADTIAPFVVINDNDAVTARSFSLLRELAHIWIGASGVSGPLRGVPENIAERFCNEIAGEFLLPPQALERLSAASGSDVDQALVLTDEVSKIWNVSQASWLTAS
jgi:Zn-dependent peptidase ImmA (M78 family)